MHDGFHHYMKRLNKLYCTIQAFYKEELEKDSFKWLEVNTSEKSLYMFERRVGKESIVVAFNFSDHYYMDISFANSEL